MSLYLVIVVRKSRVRGSSSGDATPAAGSGGCQRGRQGLLVVGALRSLRCSLVNLVHQVSSALLVVLPLLDQSLVVLLDPSLLRHQLGLGLLVPPAGLLVEPISDIIGRSLPQLGRRGLPLIHGGQPAAVRTLGSLLSKSDKNKVTELR